MKNNFDLDRISYLIDKSIKTMDLDLTGLTVLTEAASGNFISTCLIASKAKAKKVYAVTRDSRYGSADEVISFCKDSALKLRLKNIEFSEKPAINFASKSDIVTNLGFVRPIDQDLIAKLPKHSVIPLMWEPWELRSSDIDINFCKYREIPVIGTRETDERLNTFKYVGLLAAKLIFEKDIEIYQSNISIIGSNPFGSSIKECLKNIGANVSHFMFNNEGKQSEDDFLENAYNSDAIVIAEHHDKTEIIGKESLLDPVILKRNNIQIIHICGNVDIPMVKKSDIKVWPKDIAAFGHMSVTTEYVGVKPLVDLHTAGLKVGEVSCRSRLRGSSIEESIKAAEKTGLGLRLLSNKHH